MISRWRTSRKQCRVHCPLTGRRRKQRGTPRQSACEMAAWPPFLLSLLDRLKSCWVRQRQRQRQRTLRTYTRSTLPCRTNSSRRRRRIPRYQRWAPQQLRPRLWTRLMGAQHWKCSRTRPWLRFAANHELSLRASQAALRQALLRRALRTAVMICRLSSRMAYVWTHQHPPCAVRPPQQLQPSPSLHPGKSLNNMPPQPRAAQQPLLVQLPPRLWLPGRS
mmetsp:Transcript_11153/g.28160  ORF Transcript_11153/g.28160 Transcript_11153/m.28160 type:complete len:220 (-) Transcript_11153:22-681(-)